MADSSKITDVILELGEEVTLSEEKSEIVEVVTGTVTKKIFVDPQFCGDNVAYNYDFNKYGTFEEPYTMKLKYLNATNLRWLVSESEPFLALPTDANMTTINGLQYRVQDDSYGYPDWLGYEEAIIDPVNGGISAEGARCYYNPNSIMVFTFESNINPSNTQMFEGNSYSMADGDPRAVENRMGGVWNREYTEQGRLLYARGRNNTWAQGITFSWQILEGDGNVLLVTAMGIGKSSTLNAIAEVLGDTSGTGYNLEDLGLPVPSEFTSGGTSPLNWLQSVDFWSYFQFTISPWAHGYKWHYDAGAISFNSERIGRGLSGNDSWEIPAPNLYLDEGDDGIYGTDDDNYWQMVNTYGGWSGTDTNLNTGNSGVGQRFSRMPFNTGVACATSTLGMCVRISIDSLENCKVLIRDAYNPNAAQGTFGQVPEDVEFAFLNLGFEQNSSGMWCKKLDEPGFYEVIVPYAPGAYGSSNYNGNYILSTNSLLNRTTASCVVKPSVIDGSVISQCAQIKSFCASNLSVFSLEAIDENLPYSARISQCSILKGGYRLEEQEIEIIEEQVLKSTEFRNETSYEVLDILDEDKVPLSLNFNSASVKEPGKRSSGFSKTFELPASLNNQRILKSMTADNSNREKSDISWRAARIKAKGIYVFNGYARIEQMSTGGGGKYRCHIIEDPSFWPQRLGDTKLCDLYFEVNEEVDAAGAFTGNHLKNYNNIVSSWTNNVDNIPYVYPLISYGVWGGGANATIPTADLHPALYVKAIMEAIFSQIVSASGVPTPYTIESNFFNTDFFKKLIVPYTSGEDYKTNNPTLGDGGDYYASASANAEYSLPTIDNTGTGGNEWEMHYPSLNPVINPPLYVQNFSNSVQGGYQVPFTGRYRVYYSAQVKLRQGGFGDNKGRWAAWVYINGNIMDYDPPLILANPNYMGWFGTPTTSAYNSDGTQNCVWNIEVDGNDVWATKFLDVELDLNAGDEVQIAMGGLNFAGFGNAGVLHKVRGEIKDQQFFAYPTVDNTFTPPTGVLLNKALPCIKQIDFIKGITQLFNLHWTADEDTRTVMVEPYDDFYGSGKLHDWTQKIDKSNWSDKFIIEEMAKTTEFKYKVDDGDNLVTDKYNVSMETELWSLNIENGDLYRKEVFELGTDVFSPTFRIRTVNNGVVSGDKTVPTDPNGVPQPIIPCLWKGDPVNWGWFNNYSRPNNNTDFNIRILNYYGLSPETDTWALGNDINVAVNHNSYPYAYTYNYNHADSSSYEDSLSWYNIGSGATFQRGLFDRFYGEYYQKINGGAALRTCMMNLTATDIAKFDYRDIIKITLDGGVASYWTVNKIIDYKPGKNELTKVELVEWKTKAPDPYRPQVIERMAVATNYGSIDKTPKRKAEVELPNGKKVLIDTTTNNVVMSNNDPKKSTVANLSNNLTPKILSSNAPQYIAPSRSLAERMTLRDKIIKERAISIDRDGGICYYGGEVVANFEHGENVITGEVYFIDKYGKQQKLYLASKPQNTEVVETGRTKTY